MKRRSFLGMLGIAPLVAASAKLVPQKFWAGTTIPRALPPGKILELFQYRLRVPIHPFDAYRILSRPGAMAGYKDGEYPEEFWLDGVLYHQTTEIEPTPEARALIA